MILYFSRIFIFNTDLEMISLTKVFLKHKRIFLFDGPILLQVW